MMAEVVRLDLDYQYREGPGMGGRLGATVPFLGQTRGDMHR